MYLLFHIVQDQLCPLVYSILTIWICFSNDYKLKDQREWPTKIKWFSMVMEKISCIVINVTKVWNENNQFSLGISGANTLSEYFFTFIEWNLS